MFDYLSDLTALKVSIAGGVGAVITAFWTAYKTGSRQWERLYKAKDQEVSGLKKELIDIRKDPMAIAKTYIDGFQKLAKDETFKLAKERDDLVRRLAEKDAQISVLLSAEQHNRLEFEKLDEDKMLVTNKVTEYENVISAISGKLEKAELVSLVLESGELDQASLVRINQQLQARLNAIDRHPRPKAVASAKATASAMLAERHKQSAQSIASMIERTNTKAEAEQGISRKAAIAQPLSEQPHDKKQPGGSGA